MKLRHQLMTQCKVYLKAHPDRQSMTWAQVVQLCDTGSDKDITRELQLYTANVPNTPAYWSRRCGDLKAMFDQKCGATVFYTLSAADNQWQSLHRHMPHQGLDGHGRPDSREAQRNRHRDVVENPHIADSYFVQRTALFRKFVLKNMLLSDWEWDRSEWQKRGSCHAHGCAKFEALSNGANTLRAMTVCKKGVRSALALSEEKRLGAAIARVVAKDKKSDADTKKHFRLAQRLKAVVQARERRTTNGDFDTWEASHHERIVQGEKARWAITSYVDWLITSFNESGNCPDDWVSKTPYPCSTNFAERTATFEESEALYQDVVNEVERHSHHSNYCLRNGQCRFDYPRAPCAHTSIVFTVKDPLLYMARIGIDVCTARNDPLLNSHSKIQMKAWLANVDMQIILDEARAAEYVCKYATKV